MREKQELETLTAFLERTDRFIWDSLPHDGGMDTNPNLAAKVDGEGHLTPYAGSTIVFKLPEDVKCAIATVQDLLYQSCSGALAERLDPDTFHITLHDLVSGAPGDELTKQISAVRDRAVEQTAWIAGGNETVRLRSTALFNMVNTSIVLGFAPADECSCARLMNWYASFQGIVRLDYPLTPHVTVAYFRPGTLAPEQVAALRTVIGQANCRGPITVELSSNAIEYQEFSDMNHYWRAEPGMDRTAGEYYRSLCVPALKARGLKWTEPDAHTLRIRYDIGDDGQIDIVLGFHERAPLAQLECLPIACFDEDIDQGLALCNWLNSRYRWVRFYLDEQDAALRCISEVYFEERSCERLCVFMLDRMAMIVEEAYPKIIQAAEQKKTGIFRKFVEWTKDRHDLDGESCAGG